MNSQQMQKSSERRQSAERLSYTVCLVLICGAVTHLVHTHQLYSEKEED